MIPDYYGGPSSIQKAEEYETGIEVQWQPDAAEFLVNSDSSCPGIPYMVYMMS